MKRTNDRPVLCVLAIACLLVIVFCGLVMEYGWFGYGSTLPGEIGMPSVVYSTLSEGSSQSELVNINTATAIQLQALPGVGEIIAQRIVDYREEHGGFASVDELINVSGLGEVSLNKMRPYITVE